VVTTRLIGGFLILMAGVVTCRDPSQLYRHYTTHAEAVAAGEVDRGWLPVWVPGSATELHIQGDLDTKESWLRFELSAPATDSLRRALMPVSAATVTVYAPSRAQAWWFEGSIEQQPANDAALYADLYRGSGDVVPRSTVIAFARTGPRVYAWHSGE
jgi:hypothetical protein